MDLGCLKALTRRRPHNRAGVGGGNNGSPLQRRLGAWDLIFYGVGCSVGAGIYSLVGVGAHTAGPAIAVSFLVAGIACCFTSLAYAEFASLLQTAGSAYTYAYVAFGELAGWLVGWNLTLGYAVSAAVVARSWAEYLVGLLDIDPTSRWRWLTKLPLAGVQMGGEPLTCCPLSMLIIAICTAVLVTGTKESSRFNTVMTLLNLTVLTFIVIVGSPNVDTDNWQPFFPHGIPGMAQGAGLVFFSYLGFDMVSCLSEEVENPDVNMPIGIIGSLGVSIAIYVTVAAVVVGMAPVQLLGNDIPIVNALLANACCNHEQQLSVDSMECLSYTCEAGPTLHPLLFTGSRVVSFGAVFGLTTATFACLMGQPRIFYSIAKDGLFFQIYAQVNPKTGIPTLGTIITGAFTALVACLFDLESLANVISLGTLQVFTFVNAGVILLRLRPGLLLGEEQIPQEPVAELTLTSSVRSPLAQSPRHDAIARSLGMVNTTSLELRKSLRNNIQSSTRDLGIAIRQNSEDATVPTLHLLGFTVAALILSVAISKAMYWTCGVMVLTMAICTVGLYSLLPKEAVPLQTQQSTFKCPMVPAVPLFGITCNCFMMGSMQSDSWILISIWLLIGLAFYFGYGIHNSILNHSNKTSHQSGTGESQGLLSSAKAEDYKGTN